MDMRFFVSFVQLNIRIKSQVGTFQKIFNPNIITANNKLFFSSSSSLFVAQADDHRSFTLQMDAQWNKMQT